LYGIVTPPSVSYNWFEAQKLFIKHGKVHEQNTN